MSCFRSPTPESGFRRRTSARSSNRSAPPRAPRRARGSDFAMIYGFVKQSKGHIRLYSEVGQGTTAKIYCRAWRGPRNQFRSRGATRGERANTVGRARRSRADRRGRRGCARFDCRLAPRIGLFGPRRAQRRRSPLRLQGSERIDVLFTDVVLSAEHERANARRRSAGPAPRALPVLFTTGYARNAIIRDGRLSNGRTHFSPSPTRSEQSRKNCARSSTPRRRPEAHGAGIKEAKVTGSIDDGAGPFLGTLLRQIMAGAAKGTMLVPGDEHACMVRSAGVHAVRVAVDRDRRDGYGGLRGERRLDRPVSRVAEDKLVAMPVGVDDDLDEVGIVEGARAVRSKVASSNAQVGDHMRHKRRAMARRSLIKPRAPAFAVEIFGTRKTASSAALAGSIRRARCPGYCTNCPRRARRRAGATAPRRRKPPARPSHSRREFARSI